MGLNNDNIKMGILVMIGLVLTLMGGVNGAATLTSFSTSSNTIALNTYDRNVPFSFFYQVTSSSPIVNTNIVLCGIRIYLEIDSITRNTSTLYNVNACMGASIWLRPPCLAGPATNRNISIGVEVTDSLNTLTTFNVTTLFPQQYITVIVDNQPPVQVTPAIVQVETNIAYFKGKWTDSTQITSIMATFETNTNSFETFSFNEIPDAQGFYYGVVQKPSSSPLSYTLVSINVTDYYTNIASFSYNLAFQFTNPKPISFEVPDIESAIVYPPTITDYTKSHIVTYYLTFNGTKVRKLDSFSLGNARCDPVLTGDLTATVYCTIPPFFTSGLLQATVYVYGLYAVNTKIVPVKLNYQGVVGPVSIQTQTWSTKKTSISLSDIPFTMQYNISFLSTGNLFDHINCDLKNYNQYNLIEGDLFSGTVSNIVTITSEKYLNVIGSSIYDSSGNSLSTSVNVIPTVYAVPLSVNVTRLKYGINGLVDVTSGDYLSIPFEISFEANGKPIEYVQLNGLQSTAVGNDNGLIMGSNGGSGYPYTYQSQIFMAYDGFLFNGANNYFFNVFLNGYYAKSPNTIKSTCLNVKYPKQSYPNIKSIEIKPNLVNVLQQDQLVEFIITVTKGNTIAPKSFVVSTGLFQPYEPFWGSDLILFPDPQTPSSTDYVYRGSRIIAKNTLNTQFVFKYSSVDITGIVTALDEGYTAMNFPNQLSVIGPNQVYYRRPIISKMSISGDKVQFQLDSDPEGASIRTVSFNYLQGSSFNSKEQVIYEVDWRDIPQRSIQAEFSTLIECNAKSLKQLVPLDKTIEIVVIDSNGLKFVYPWGMLGSPNFTSPNCIDNFPPVIQSVNLPAGVNVDTSNTAQTITIEFQITDGYSGFKNMTVQLLAQGSNWGERYQVNQGNRVNGNPNNGLYRLNITFPLHSMGSIDISVPYITDQHENSRSYYDKDLVPLFTAQSGGSVLYVTSVDPIVVTPSIDTLEYNTTVANDGTWTCVVKTIGVVNSVYVNVTERGYINSVEAIQSESNANEWIIKGYEPSHYGVHFLTVILNGDGILRRIYSSYELLNMGSTGNSFKYFGKRNLQPWVTSISQEMNSKFQVKGTFDLPNAQEGYKMICYLTDTKIGKSYQGGLVHVGTGYQYQCNVKVDSFTDETRQYKWSFSFNILGDYLPTKNLPANNHRYLSSQEIETIFGITTHTFTVDNPTVPSTATHNQLSTLLLFILIITISILFN